MSAPPTTLDIDSVRETVARTVLVAGEPGYDERRALHTGGFDRRPALIVVPADAAEVARAVALARDTGLELAVRSGGHHAAGLATTEGGLLLDLRDLRQLTIDAERRIVRVGAGLTAGEVTRALSLHRLAVGFGDTASVGVSGLTLGGGIGLLSRKHGLAVDSLLAAELVTADSRLHRVSADVEPDLFWALRGGGGNLGVVTSLTFRLVEVDPFLGGRLVLPATPETLAGFVRLATEAPRELTTIVNVVPAAMLGGAAPAGSAALAATLAWTGDLDAGEAAVAPFRALATPLVDDVVPRPYADMLAEGPEGAPPVSVNDTVYLRSLDVDGAAGLVDWVRGAAGYLPVVQLRVLGGAIADVPADATAYAHREAPILAFAAAILTGPGDRAVAGADVARVLTGLPQHPGAYVNFLGHDDGPRVAAAYPGRTGQRLAAVKAQVDPDNLFHRTHGVARGGGR
ncbi:FAD-binding oxidoreductase [Georgenia sp. H159]|uniref:FAD-binding oxidoreductase n=1 Tax=Georgenia sp. H159 TaxID=3076115 RepID=UPI002D7840AA|nr:FAD-binding protein [Georgenia sp. H159]